MDPVRRRRDRREGRERVGAPRFTGPHRVVAELLGAAGGGRTRVGDAVTMAEYLRIDHRYVDGTMTGGSSFEFHVQHGAAAIREGLCDSILVTYGSDQLSRMGRHLGTGGFQRGGEEVVGPTAYAAPYGNP